MKNGFYAFEPALHLLPSGSEGRFVGLEDWNEPHLWRDTYQNRADGLRFFAEDIFGGQFAIREDVIVIFDPETGDSEESAESFEGFAEAILRDYNVLTGHPIARQWQEIHRAIAIGKRLCPMQLFMLDREYAIDNVMALGAVQGMRLRGEIATQIRNLPYDAEIELKIIE